MRDPNAVVYLIPGVGMITFAKNKSTARIAGEFYVNAINVMRDADRADQYVGLPEQEAFDIEYWLLEEAKSLLAKLEREHKENITKAKEIIEDAELSSKKILEESKSEIKLAVSRKLQLAERQIQANEKDLINAIKVDLIDEAFKLAQEQIENKVNLEMANLIAEESLSEIEIKLS